MAGAPGGKFNATPAQIPYNPKINIGCALASLQPNSLASLALIILTRPRAKTSTATYDGLPSSSRMAWSISMSWHIRAS